MRIPMPGRRWLVVVVVLVLVVVATIHFLDRPNSIEFYRLIDQQTIGLETSAGPGSWTRVTSLVETPSSVTVIVSTIEISFGPGADVRGFVEATAKLSSPLGDRVVVDGSSGQTLKPAPSPWPPQLGPQQTP